MNRCTLIYIDTGIHNFHTIFQKPTSPILFQSGEIYFSEIISRTTWPPLFPAKKKDSVGKRIEYGIALLYFINNTKALDRWKKINKKEISKNR